MLLETIITNVELCTALLIYADSPRHSIIFACLTVHFGGTASILKLLNPFS